MPSTGHGICEGGKTKHILGCTSFMGGEHMIDFGTGENNVCVFVAC